MDEPNRIVEAVIIGVYLVFLLGIGLAFRKFNSNISDYFRNGCRGTWWLVGSSAFMAGISAYTFTGASGVAYSAGWSVAIIYIGNSLGFLAAFLVFAPWFRQLRAITGPEVVSMRYGVFTQQFYAGFDVLTALLSGGLQLWAVSIFTSAIFGFEVWHVIVVVGTVVVLYSTVGGSWAVMATDFVQSLIMMPLTVLISILCLLRVGGVSGFFRTIEESGLRAEFSMIKSAGDFPLAQFTFAWAAAMIISQAGLSNTIVSAQRYFSVKDGREARKAAFLAFVMMSVGSVFWFIPPMVSRLLFESDVMRVGAQLNDPAEAAFAVASLMVLPMGLTGLIVVAMFSATMSSIDSGVNRCAAIFVRDVYPALCKVLGRAPGDEREQLVLGRVISLGLGCIIILTAVYFSVIGGRGMFEVMLNVVAMLGVPLAVPMLAGLFVRRVPSWAALFSAVCGLLPSVFAAIFDISWNFQTKVFVNVGVGGAAFCLSGLFWKSATEAYRKRVKEFFERMYRPVNFEKEIGGANDFHQLRLIGAFTAASGGFIFLLLFLPNGWQDRMSIFFLAAILVLIGGIMRRSGKTPGESVPNKKEEQSLRKDNEVGVNGPSKSGSSMEN